MSPIRKKYEIHAPLTSVWKALVDPLIIAQWGAGPAEMDHKVGTEFVLWGGDIHGKNLAVEEERKLVQEWYTKNWLSPSRVTIALMHKNGTTIVSLEHKNVPEKEYNEIRDGWDTFYFGEIKKFLEK